MQERIKACFTESIQTQIAAAEALPDAISRAAMTLVQSLLNGNKILCCGNGTSAANAQHFAASMINRLHGLICQLNVPFPLSSSVTQAMAEVVNIGGVSPGHNSETRYPTNGK